VHANWKRLTGLKSAPGWLLVVSFIWRLVGNISNVDFVVTASGNSRLTAIWNFVQTPLGNVLLAIIGFGWLITLVYLPKGESDASGEQPGTSRIVVHSADWGIPSDYKDRTIQLQAYLDGKTHDLSASNRFFVDEHPKKYKQLRVRYSLPGSTEVKTRLFAEGERVRFDGLQAVPEPPTESVSQAKSESLIEALRPQMSIGYFRKDRTVEKFTEVYRDKGRYAEPDQCVALISVPISAKKPLGELRARLTYYDSFGTEYLLVPQGCWLEEDYDSVLFSVGQVHKLILASEFEGVYRAVDDKRSRLASKYEGIFSFEFDPVKVTRVKVLLFLKDRQAGELEFDLFVEERALHVRNRATGASTKPTQ